MLYNFALFVFVLLYNLRLLDLGYREDFLGMVSSAGTLGCVAWARCSAPRRWHGVSGCGRRCWLLSPPARASRRFPGLSDRPCGIVGPGVRQRLSICGMGGGNGSCGG